MRMSSLTHTKKCTSIKMTQPTGTRAEATLQFAEIDTSVDYGQRGLFAPAARKQVKDVAIDLNDARTDSRIAKGAEGLDVQGFAYTRHRSALQESDLFFSGRNVEDIYLPEVCDLICRMTGAKKAIVNNCAFRHKLVDLQKDPYHYIKKGDPIDAELGSLPRDKVLVAGKDKDSLMEPARMVHVDYTAEGLRRTIRECRKDITAMGEKVIEAENAKARGEDVKVPRYAAYSVWRPLATVKRDPLVVCDYRTIEKETVSKHRYRCTSEQNADGEYVMEYWDVGIPKDSKKAQWYWMPEQTSEDVLIIKFADTAAETDPDIARYGAHASPHVKGTEDEEARISVECRVIAFWE